MSVQILGVWAIALALVPTLEAGTPRPPVRAVDGVEYVFVPPGSFTMGCVPDDTCENDEKPAHRVTLGQGFWMSRTETTVAAFRRFTAATGYRTSAELDGWSYSYSGGTDAVKTEDVDWRSPGFEQGDMHPVVQVSWYDAEAYCAWSGGRLPREAEWEYAARGGAGGARSVWGSEKMPLVDGKKQANVADEAARRVFGDWKVAEGYDDGFARTASVASFAPNGFGLFDMAGNALELCADWYDAAYYRSSAAADGTAATADPRGPDTGAQRVARGGSWLDGPSLLRVSNRYRYAPIGRDGGVGFRCVRDTPPPARASAAPKETQAKKMKATAAPPPSDPPRGGEARTNRRDVLAYVFVPPGVFDMGCAPGDAECKDEEKPAHAVELARGFWLGRTEVTVAAFRRFVEATRHRTTAEADGWGYSYEGERLVRTPGVTWSNPGFVQEPAHPVTQVSWYDAQAYCAWSGGRLPSEAEWEYTARAGRPTARYAWGGDTMPVVDGRPQANVADEAAKRQFPGWTALTGYDDGFVRTAPAGTFAPNAFGLHDLAGNVDEWSADWFDDKYYAASPARDPQGPRVGLQRVSRGGAWNSLPAYLRVSYRNRHIASEHNVNLGFRCARDISP